MGEYRCPSWVVPLPVLPGPNRCLRQLYLALGQLYLALGQLYLALRLVILRLVNLRLVILRLVNLRLVNLRLVLEHPQTGPRTPSDWS